MPSPCAFDRHSCIVLKGAYSSDLAAPLFHPSQNFPMRPSNAATEQNNYSAAWLVCWQADLSKHDYFNFLYTRWLIADQAHRTYKLMHFKLSTYYIQVGAKIYLRTVIQCHREN